MEELEQWSEEDLWAKLTEATGHERIDVLFELGSRASQRQDFATASTLWQEIEAAAEECLDVPAAAEAIRLQGNAAFHTGNFFEAMEFYSRAAKAYEIVGRPRDVAIALWGLGDSCRALGDHESQLAAAQDCRSIAESEAALTLAGDACLLEARALYMLDRDEEAVASCTAGRNHFRAAELPERVIEADDFAVTVHLYLGNLDEALELARGCLVLARTASSGQGEPQARLRLAEVLWRRGDSEQALEHAELAMAVCRERNDLTRAAACERLRAEAWVDKDELEKALDAFSSARVLYDATGQDYDALRCEIRSAMVHHHMGDFGQAARINRRLVDAFSGSDDLADDLRCSIVRLLDNLVEDGLHADCLEVAEHGMEAWPEGVTADDSTYREFLGLYALALEATGRAELATSIAGHVIGHAPAREASQGVAYCYEVRGRSQLDQDEASASRDLSHAIALHLARGRVDRARDLSKYFLSTGDETGSRGGSGVRQEDDLSGAAAGHG